MGDVWQAIGSDPKLQHARRVLSIDEFRMICRHAWDNPPDPARDKAEIERRIAALSDPAA